MNLKMIIGTCLSIISVGALAGSSVSNYVEVGYTSQDNDILLGDYTGFEMAGSYQLNDDFYLVGEYITTKEDRDLEIMRKGAGVGIVLSADESSAWYTEFSFVNVQFDRDYAASFDQTGFQLGFGYQLEFAENWTVNADVTRLHAREVDPTFGDYSPTFVTLGGNYAFSDAFSVYGDFEYESDGDRVAFGLRYSFQNCRLILLNGIKG